MANLFGSNPWVVDTPGAGILCNTDVKVSHFEFTAYAAQGNSVIVQDRNGKVIWQTSGAADQEEVRSGKVGQVHGIVVPTLVAGKLLIFFE